MKKTIITLILITGVGYFGSNLITRGVFRYFDDLFTRLPFIKILYNSSKDLINAFVGDKKSFEKPVLVTMNSENGAKALGFITRESMDFLGVRDHVAVYIPQSYTFGGNVFIYPKNQVTTIDADSGSVMAFLLSGGVSDGT